MRQVLIERLLRMLLVHVWLEEVVSETPPFLRFGYQKSDFIKPREWAKKYPKCGGKEQSPVDLVACKKRIMHHTFNTTFISTVPEKVEIVNTAHTVMIKFYTSERLEISGGVLSEPYTLTEVHMHWGPNNSVGSEHTNNGARYPMEMHMVFYKSSAYSEENALKMKDGFAVFAIWHELAKVDNFYLDSVVSMLDYIQRPFTDVELCTIIDPVRFLPENIHTFYMYRGSMTTPPCTEGVLWFVFNDTNEISDYQLFKLRRLSGEWEQMELNYRPLQPLNGRTITLVSPELCTLAPFERRKKRSGRKTGTIHEKRNILNKKRCPNTYLNAA